jgi:hypothetical protein
MKRTVLLVGCILLVACNSTSPDTGSAAKAQINEDKLKSTIQQAFNEDSTLKIVKSIYGDADSVGPIFIEGTNARSAFKMKSTRGQEHEAEARMSFSQDGHWYLVYVHVPDVQGGLVRCNYLIE